MTNDINKTLSGYARRSAIFVLRTLIQLVFFGWELCSDLVDRINERFTGLFVEKEYLRTGQCKMTGQCCKAIGIEYPQSWTAKPRLVSFLARWHSLRYNFTVVGQNDNMLVYECRYLRADNRCGIHKFKPKLCRDFPSRPWRGKIRLHKGCGYQFRSRKSQEFSVILHRKPPRSPQI